MHPFIQSLLKELAAPEDPFHIDPVEWETFANAFIKMRPNSTMDEHFKGNLRKMLLNQAHQSNASVFKEKTLNRGKKWAWLSKFTLLGGVAMASFVITMQLYSPTGSETSFLSPSRTLPQLPRTERQYPQIPSQDKQYRQLNSGAEVDAPEDLALEIVEDNDEGAEQRSYPRIPTLLNEETVGEQSATFAQADEVPTGGESILDASVENEESQVTATEQPEQDTLPDWLQTIAVQSVAYQAPVTQPTSELTSANQTSTNDLSSENTQKETEVISATASDDASLGSHQDDDVIESNQDGNADTFTSSADDIFEEIEESPAKIAESDTEEVQMMGSLDELLDVENESSLDTTPQETNETADSPTVNGAYSFVVEDDASLGTVGSAEGLAHTNVDSMAPNPAPQINVEYQYSGNILNEENEIFLNWPSEIEVLTSPPHLDEDPEYYPAISVHQAIQIALNRGPQYEDFEETIFPELGEPTIQLHAFYSYLSEQTVWMNALFFPVLDWDTYPQDSVPTVVIVPLGEGVLE